MATQLVTKQIPKKLKIKPGVWTLVFAILMPLLLTITMIFLFGSEKKYKSLTKQFWFPPLWLLNIASMGCSSLMGFAAWIMWVDGRLHVQTNALPLYIAHVSLSIVWNPLVLRIGTVWLGAAISLLHFGTLFGCYLHFGCANSLAKHLTKPCLVWVAFLTYISFKLSFI